MQFHIILVVVSIVETTSRNIHHKSERRYKSNWADLDNRPLPQWYDEAKVGIFVHWGVYSVPGIMSEWFWYRLRRKNKEIVQYMKNNFPPNFVYQNFAPMLKAEFFDPQKWAKLFEKAGAKYVILTSKHHDGFALFPTNLTWNSEQIGPKQDLVAAISQAVRKQGLKFGVYHSLYEWFNPLYDLDKKNKFSSSKYVDSYVLPILTQLVNDYEPSVIWSDGDWEAGDIYWKSKDFLSWLYNKSPVKNEVVVNDRWGRLNKGKHGDFYNYQDRYNNKTLQIHKWENAFTIDRLSWGYRKNMDLSDVLSFKELLIQLVTTVSCGGNVLINVGSTKEGTIVPIFEERLLTLGEWLGINGEAIYKTSPWSTQDDTVNKQVWYTCSKQEYNGRYPTAIPTLDEKLNAIYAIALELPNDNTLKLQAVAIHLLNGAFSRLELLGNKGELKWQMNNGIVEIRLPEYTTVKSENAWVIKFTIR